jgi:hypothetical protein
MQRLLHIKTIIVMQFDRLTIRKRIERQISMATPLKLGGGDQFSADPQTLRDTAPTYYQTAQQITTLQQSLVSAVQTASGDMFLLLEFAQLASKLEQLQARIDAAMLCASMGLNRIGVALSIAADEYKETDQQVSSTFTRIEDDTNQTNPAPTITPGINIFNLPGKNSGGIPPVKPQPGVQPEPTPPFIIPGITGPGGILTNIFQTQPDEQKSSPQPKPLPWIDPEIEP